MGTRYKFEVVVNDYNGDLQDEDEVKLLLEQCRYLDFVTATCTGSDEIEDE